MIRARKEGEFWVVDIPRPKTTIKHRSQARAEELALNYMKRTRLGLFGEAAEMSANGKLKRKPRALSVDVRNHRDAT